jgi:ABC-type multidrug transport system permease subunit
VNKDEFDYTRLAPPKSYQKLDPESSNYDGDIKYMRLPDYMQPSDYFLDQESGFTWRAMLSIMIICFGLGLFIGAIFLN